MKKTIYLLGTAAMAVSVLAVGCKDPESGEVKQPEVVVSTSLDAFNEKYDINMQVLTLADTTSWRNNGDADLPTRYTVTTEAKALELANFLEKEVFSIFGDEFIANVMPPTIFVADSVVYSYVDEFTDVNPDWKPKKATDDEWSWMDGVEMMGSKTNEVNLSLYGEVGNYHLTLSTRHLDDADKTALKKGYLSLIIERMMANTSKWPEPAEFIKISEDAHDLIMNNDIEPNNMSVKYNFFYQESLASANTSLLVYAGISKYDPKFSVWWFCGALNPNRYGPQNHSAYTKEFCDQFNWVYDYTENDEKYVSPETTESYWFNCMTYQQDFGDFVAHIIFDSPEVKSALYSRVDAASWNNTEEKVTRTCDSKLMKDKIELVKAYFKTNFDITLPEAE